ncbi:MAG TPA: S53 family peptidase [Steroidobacteraceae bacterium]|nr:S53 family peptidase [Steroidobacteraceae bacterium]
MSRIRHLASLFLIFAVGAFSSSIAYAGAAAPEAHDLGPTSAQADAAPISITVALRMRSLQEAENLLVSLHTPGDPQFRKFLTAEEFVARFAPTDAEVAKVTAALGRYGLSAQRASALTLRVTGLAPDLERAFAVSLHSYRVAPHGNEPGYTFHAPLSRAVIPAEIAGSLSAVVGLDNRPSLRPHLRQSVQHPRAAPSSGTTINPPGLLTVADFASYYDVTPLYRQGISGKGRTLAIVTLANLTPSDAFGYWASLGLKVDPKRLTLVNIDGGPGAPSDASGSIESTLDVQQSGGLAPGANIIVYLAPNTNQAFLDAFVQAAEDNRAESISTSWGNWEWFSNLENSPVTDPLTGQTTGETQAMHEQFVRAAIQGQSLFAAAGDGGAYDVNNDTGCVGPYDPTQTISCTTTLTVDYPASDTAMSAAGGTTLPGIQGFCLNAGCTDVFEINVPQERVWGWDYLTPLCEVLGFDPVSCGIFPGGGGGGVSVMFPRPIYQYLVPGVQRSQPAQEWQSTPTLAAALGVVGTSYNLPANYPGRNVPDVSFNADPETGYIIPYTSDVSGFSVQAFYGGTSFVAPQLNGLTALFGQETHQRLGLMNFELYGLVLSQQAYGGRHAPLRAIAYGDNWFYQGSHGYNPAAGVGVMDVANFAKALQ